MTAQQETDRRRAHAASVALQARIKKKTQRTTRSKNACACSTNFAHRNNRKKREAHHEPNITQSTARRTRAFFTPLH